MVYRHAIIEGEPEAVARAREFLSIWRNGEPHITARTSGSTGTPKEVLLPKADMKLSAMATNSRFGINSRSLLLLPLSVDYIAGKMMLVRAEMAGCRIILEKPCNNPLHSTCGAIDLMAVVPSQCESLTGNPLAGNSVRNLIVGGAPISPDLERRLAKMPWRSFATYGMTETCSHVALRPLGSPDYQAMPGVSFATDSRSCLTILAPCYSFGQLQTNDVVTLLSSTSFRWRGRADNTINSGGIKLHPEEIEARLAPFIPYPFYIDGVPDPMWGTALRLNIETGDSAHAEAAGHNENKINLLCREKLSRYEVPKVVRFVERFSRTSSGKIKR